MINDWMPTVCLLSVIFRINVYNQVMIVVLREYMVKTPLT